MTLSLQDVILELMINTDHNSIECDIPLTYLFLKGAEEMNRLEQKLGLIETSVVDIVYQEPTAAKLEKVPKTAQTYDMLKHVCHHDGLALKYASKKLITQDLCEIAVKENGLAFEFIPERILKTADKHWISTLCEIAVSRNGKVLQYIPNELKNPSIIKAAVSNNGRAIKYAPISLVSKEIAELAVSQCGHALQYVPDSLKTPDIILKAISSETEIIKSRTHPVAFIPPNLLTREVLYKAVETHPFCIRDLPPNRLSKKLAEFAVEHDGLALGFIPSKHRDANMVKLAISQNALAIRYVPKEYITEELCKECFDRECAVLHYLPTQFITKEMCLKVIEKRRFLVSDVSDSTKEMLFGTTDVKVVLFDDIPEKLRNDIDILNAIIPLYKYGSTEILRWNERISGLYDTLQSYEKNKRNEDIKPLQKKTIAYLKKKAIPTKKEKEENCKKEIVASIMKSNIIEYAKSTEIALQTDIPQTYSLVPVSNDRMIHHDLSQSEWTSSKIYYISDIHIEHQLPEELERIPMSDRMDYTINFITQKIREMVSEIPENRDDILLIGGDVADNIYLSEIFYRILKEHWKGGTVIAVLGNHELWERTSVFDTLARMADRYYQPRPVEEIVDDYKKMIHSGWWLNRQHLEAGYDRPTSWNLSNQLYVNSVLLENELYIRYQGRLSRVIHEDEILEASVEELTDILAKCTFILLGGIGFSGLNPAWNATAGLYSKTIESLEEDKRLTEKFRLVYEKVERCAADRKVIVLTHTPVYDWTNAPCNKNWIYVNGHTHQNILSLDENTTVFADNQIGYKPQKWKLNALTVDNCWYDPFANYENGIYKITSDQYKDFNRGRGILCNGCNYEGTLYMLKRKEMYMFLLQSSKSLCLMAGGQRKKLDRKDVQYYYDNMVLYADMVRKKTEPYQKVMKSLSKEIKQIGGNGTIHGCIVDVSFFSHLYVNPFDGTITPYWALDIMSRLYYKNFQALLEKHEPELLRNYFIENKAHSLPLIGNLVENESNIPETDVVPQWMSGTEIYQSSKILKAFQYVWGQNVIRIWNDNLLQDNSVETKKLLE